MNQKTNEAKVLNGIGWSSLSSIINYILLFTRTFILVRILAPQDFGLMALSLLLLSTIKQFSYLGLEQALIQQTNVNKSTVNTIWTISIIRGIFFFALIVLISPYYANFFTQPNLISILYVLSFASIISGFKNSYVSVLQKELKFDIIFKLVVISGLVEFCTTIALAIIYENVMALAVGYLMGAIANVLLSFLLISRKPNFSFNYNEFIQLFRFGKWVLGGGVIIFLIVNIDTFVIGKLLGVTLLGLYQIVYRFSNFAATDIVLTFSQSIYPSFALVKKDLNELKKYFLNTILIITFIIMPIMTILLFYAQDFIYYLIGPDWIPALLTFEILILFGMTRSLASICGFVFWTIGKPKIQTYISFFQFILICILIYPLSIKYSIAGTAAAITLPLIISSWFSYYFVKKELNFKIKDIISYLSAPILGLISLILTMIYIQNNFEYINSTLLFLTNFIFLFALYLIFTFIYDYIGNKRVINLIMNAYNHSYRDK